MTAPQTPVSMQGSVQFDMESKISGRTYRIFVFKPAAPPPPGGYPVVTVTDANLMFPLAATLIPAFTMNGGRAALVVGVGYPADDYLTPLFLRNRDLTPPTPLANIQQIPGLPPPVAENYGGSAEFARFLIEELRPAIARDYPVDASDQTLFGHSLGGLFTLGVLFRQPGAFRTFVASSPSIWWNQRALLKGEAGYADMVKSGSAAPRVLIVVGDQEQQLPYALPPGMTRPQMKKLLTAARMVDNARELAARLGAIQGAAGYSVRFHAFDDEDHMTVVPAAVGRALTFALRDG